MGEVEITVSKPIKRLVTNDFPSLSGIMRSEKFNLIGEVIDLFEIDPDKEAFLSIVGFNEVGKEALNHTAFALDLLKLDMKLPDQIIDYLMIPKQILTILISQDQPIILDRY
jgi:hypothetical protein